jgi:hypothetical protein
MTINFLVKRSNVQHKRPTNSQLQTGELSLNYQAQTPGLFVKNESGGIVKIGPCEVGSTFPNSSPAGSSGNSLGEMWYDTGSNVVKVFNGSTFSPSLALAPVSSTAPTAKENGSLWFSTTAGKLLVYYDDGDSQQWVDTSPAPLITSAAGLDKEVQYNTGGTLAGTSFLQIESDKVTLGSNLLPSTDNTYNLGSETFRFANIYTGDLHLKNDRGDWTLIEEEDCLTIRNNKTGKVYDILMKERLS